MIVDDLQQYLCDIEKEFDILKSVNEVLFYEVIEGIRLSDGLKVAIKKLFNEQNFVLDLDIPVYLNHPFCMNLVNFSLNPQTMIVTLFMSNVNLLDLIKNDDKALSTHKNCLIYALISTMNLLHKVDTTFETKTPV